MKWAPRYSRFVLLCFVTVMMVICTAAMAMPEASAEPADSLAVDSLVVYPKRIVIVKSEFKLYLLEGADTLAVYSVALGRNPGDKQKVGDCRTPEGDFYIDRIVNSSGWKHDFAGDGKGEIKGAYGPWFLGLYTGADVSKAQKTWVGIAIHGTHDPGTIGTLASEGCVRLRNEDILQLKEQAYLKMPVSIVP